MGISALLRRNGHGYENEYMTNASTNIDGAKFEMKKLDLSNPLGLEPYLKSQSHQGGTFRS